MKLNKSYIRRLISEQLQEIQSPLDKPKPIPPGEIPGYVASLPPQAAAAETSAGMAQGALSQILQVAGEAGGDPAAAAQGLAAIAEIAQGALEGIPDAAQEAAEEAAKG